MNLNCIMIDVPTGSSEPSKRLGCSKENARRKRIEYNGSPIIDTRIKITEGTTSSQRC
jgi:hypothetical protein